MPFETYTPDHAGDSGTLRNDPWQGNGETGKDTGPVDSNCEAGKAGNPSTERSTVKARTVKWNPPFIPPGEVDLFYINRILKAGYGSPDHGNPKDPLDDLIYLLLTRKTPIEKGQRVFRRLRRAVGDDWGNLTGISREKLGRIIGELGLVETRLRDLPAVIVEIRNRFGRADLSKLRRWPNSRCLEFLSGLPGVGTKTARCVMLYALGRKVFPADTHCIRVLARVGLIPESLIERHREAQEILSSIIPPDYAYDLHVNLIAHGQSVCTPKNPGCTGCIIRKFCTHYRNECRRKWEDERALPSAIDLFCGAGGTGIGLSQFMSGDGERKLRISAAVDIDRWAAKTYWVNHPELPAERVLTENLCNRETIQRIRRLTADENVILVIGGPPCQDFSLIGTPGRNSVRPVNGRRFIEIEGNHNYAAFVTAVREIGSRFFVMENVPAILAANGKRARREILEDFSDLYHCSLVLLDAARCGVPQRRLRVLIFGVRREPDENVARSALDFIMRRMESLSGSGTRPVTFRQAVSDMPPLSSGQGSEFTGYKKRRGSLSEYQKIMRNGSGILFNHVARPNNERDLKLYELLRPGEIAADAVEKYNRPELMIYRNDVFRDKYKKQHWEKPSSTIVAHLSRDGHMFIHPEQTRSITVREAARIQSFPDDFIFCGTRTAQFQQVGNAVPPLMAYYIREVIFNANERFFPHDAE